MFKFSIGSVYANYAIGHISTFGFSLTGASIMAIFLHLVLIDYITGKKNVKEEITLIIDFSIIYFTENITLNHVNKHIYIVFEIKD